MKFYHIVYYHHTLYHLPQFHRYTDSQNDYFWLFLCFELLPVQYKYLAHEVILPYC